MRKLSGILAFLLAVSNVAMSGAADEGCVSSWNFDGALKDARGASKDNLSASGGAERFVTAAQIPGVSGKALALGVKPGDTGCVSAVTSADVKLGASYTIEAWVLPTKTGQWNRLVLNWGERYGYHVAIHYGKLSLYHGQVGGGYVFAEGGKVPLGVWSHLAGVARRNDKNPAKSTLEVYINGKLVDSSPYDGTIATLKKEGLGIGDAAGGNGAASGFRGYIDELAIWNRALPASEIAKHYAMRAAKLKGLAAVATATVAKTVTLPAKPFNPARLKTLGVKEIVFAERNPGRDPQGHYYANFGYSCGNENLWLHGKDGGRLCKLNVESGKVAALLDDPKGAVRDPQVSYDAKKVLFAYRKGGTHYYNLYEIDIDGKNLRRITKGAWDDIEPAYLPDGGIVFASARCKRYIGCWLAQTAILFRCDSDGGNMRMLSSGSFTENTPSVLPDGRVLYTRWEYVNRDPVVFHHLWTMNPDGTNQAAFFGNMHPGGVFIDARPIAGTDRVVFINSPGHGRNEHQGFVATVTDKNGPDDKSSMRNVSKRRDFRDPCAVAADAFLAAKGNQIVLMDSSGATTVIHTAATMVHEPRPVTVLAKPRLVPSRVDLSKTTGTMMMSDVYIGRNMGGIDRGAIRKLLVLEDLPKPANFHGGGSQPLGHGVTSTLKRVLGTVPVESDGSAHFKVPAMRSIYLAALDENDLSVKQMRSFITLQPGETLSCVGCHEQRTKTPNIAAVGKLKAMGRPADKIEPFAGIRQIPDFPRDIQPILDRHCIKCHNSKDRKGNVILTGDRGPVFSHSYYELFFQWQIKDTAGNPANGSGRQKGNDKPYTTYSSASALMKKIDTHHNKVKLSAVERNTVRLWIDASAQYPGTYAAIGTGQVGGCWGANKYVRVMADKWPDTAAAKDAVDRRCGKCHGRKLPKHVTDVIPVSFGDMLSWERPLSRFSRHRVYNLTNPDKSLVLIAPLSKVAGGYASAHPEPKLIRENLAEAPKAIKHPVIFSHVTDPDYIKILAHIRAAKAKLDEIKRFDMPGFKPNSHYIREMKRYKVLDDAFDLTKQKINVYEMDMKYWRSMWHKPTAGKE
jgi:hypothetical protein